MSDPVGAPGVIGVPMVAIVPDNVRDVEFTVMARWSSAGGIALGRRPVPVNLGLPLDLVMQSFLELCQSGQVRRRRRTPEGEFEVDAEGRFVTEPVDDFYEVSAPAPPATAPKIIPGA